MLLTMSAGAINNLESNVLLSEHSRGVVTHTPPADITALPMSVVPNINIDGPLYDIHSTEVNELIHSECPHVSPVGISFGKSSWFRYNWCHQLRGVYLNG